MSIDIKWADYLQKSPAYENLVMNTHYIEEWNEYLQKNENKILATSLTILPNKLYINDEAMILDYLLINGTEKVIKNVEMNVTLTILGEEYFTGFLRTKKGFYEELFSNEGRIDIIDFGNDRYKNQVLDAKDFELKIYSCKAIEYIDQATEEKIGGMNG